MVNTRQEALTIIDTMSDDAVVQLANLYLLGAQRFDPESGLSDMAVVQAGIDRACELRLIKAVNLAHNRDGRDTHYCPLCRGELSIKSEYMGDDADCIRYYFVPTNRDTMDTRRYIEHMTPAMVSLSSELLA